MMTKKPGALVGPDYIHDLGEWDCTYPPEVFDELFENYGHHQEVEIGCLRRLPNMFARFDETAGRWKLHPKREKDE